MEEEAKLPEPTYAPELVARVILDCAERPTRDVNVGGKDSVMTKMGQVFPRFTDRVMEATLFDQQKKDTPFVGNRHGTVQEPDPGGGHVHGSASAVLQTSLYTQAQQHPILTMGLAVAAGAALAALTRRN
jgi:hypothetical protein